jgi:hypothetical protein
MEVPIRSAFSSREGQQLRGALVVHADPAPGQWRQVLRLDRGGVGEQEGLAPSVLGQQPEAALLHQQHGPDDARHAAPAAVARHAQRARTGRVLCCCRPD